MFRYSTPSSPYIPRPSEQRDYESERRPIDPVTFLSQHPEFREELLRGYTLSEQEHRQKMQQQRQSTVQADLNQIPINNALMRNRPHPTQVDHSYPCRGQVRRTEHDEKLNALPSSSTAFEPPSMVFLRDIAAPRPSGGCDQFPYAKSAYSNVFQVPNLEVPYGSASSFMFEPANTATNISVVSKDRNERNSNAQNVCLWRDHVSQPEQTPSVVTSVRSEGPTHVPAVNQSYSSVCPSAPCYGVISGNDNLSYGPDALIIHGGRPTEGEHQLAGPSSGRKSEKIDPNSFVGLQIKNCIEHVVLTNRVPTDAERTCPVPSCKYYRTPIGPKNYTSHLCTHLADTAKRCPDCEITLSTGSNLVRHAQSCAAKRQGRKELMDKPMMWDEHKKRMVTQPKASKSGWNAPVLVNVIYLVS